MIRDLSAVYSDLAGPEHLIRSPVAALPPMSAKMSGRLISLLARQGRHPLRERLRRQVPQARVQRGTGRHRLMAVNPPRHAPQPAHDREPQRPRRQRGRAGRGVVARG